MTTPKHAFDELPAHIRSDTFIRAARELALSLDNDRATVLVAAGFLEMIVGHVVTTLCKHAKGSLLAGKIAALHDKGLIDDQLHRQLVAFKDLRNEAAHETFFKVEDEALARIAESDLYRQAHHPLHFVCLEVLGNFWNQHKDVLAPVYSPGLMTGFNSSPHT